MAETLSSVAAKTCSLNDDSNWFNGVLAVLYGVVSFFALVQLVRIQCRVPDYGWTTQKLFHLLNFVVNGVRCIAFMFYNDSQHLNSEIVQHVLLDATSLAFISTYALLILFWAEIYYQARYFSTDGLRPSFYTINAVVYTIQIVLWFILWRNSTPFLLVWSKVFLTCVSLFPALGFLFYGGRLFVMLYQLAPSKGQQRKLHEVGYVTAICFTCFLIRCVMTCFNAFDPRVMDHPSVSFTYYMLVEIVPSSLVLYLLKKLPPKRASS